MWRELLIGGVPRAKLGAALALGVAVCGAPRSAFAHGSAPSAIEVLAAGDGFAPTFVALSYGLAKRESTGEFSFVCPAAWGSEDAVVASRGDVLAAVAEGRLHVGAAGCALAPRPRDETMVDVVGTDAGLLALGKTPTSTRVFSVTATETRMRAEASHVGPDACELDAITATADGRLVGACAAPRPALYLPAEQPSVRPFVLPFAASRLVPRVVAGGTTSLLAVGNEGSFLVEVDEAEPQAPPRIAGPFAIVLGPVQVDGWRVAVIDGHLWTLRESGWTQGAAVPFTCLSQVGPAAYACSLGNTVRLSRRGDEIVGDEAVFSLSMVGEPTATCAEASGDAAVCRGEWAHFGAEAGLLDTLPATTPGGVRRAKTEAPGATGAPTGPGEGGGCAVASGRRPGAFAITLLAAAASLGSRLRRRRPSFGKRSPAA